MIFAERRVEIELVDAAPLFIDIINHPQCHILSLRTRVLIFFEITRKNSDCARLRTIAHDCARIGSNYARIFDLWIVDFSTALAIEAARSVRA